MLLILRTLASFENMPDRFDTDPAVDEKLLANVLLGDNDAAQTLVSRLAPFIRRVAARLVRPDHRELREDLVQEVWLHLWSKNCRVLQEWNRRGPLLHYVIIVASNLMRDRLARRKIPTVPMPMDDDSDWPDPDDPLRTIEVRQLAECLERAKNRLSQMHRELIHLRHELALKHNEIAAKLGKTIGYVGTTLARAERYLRDELLEACADHLGSFRSIF
jgi:RNA polymerase sigma factor (sigma-70 family)